MIKLLGIALLLCTYLMARENPFFPSAGEVDIPITTNVTQNIKPLTQATLVLPSTARVIEGFSVTYKNLDGSVSSKSVKLNNSIDWHLPLFLSQNYTTHTTTAKASTSEKEKPSKYSQKTSLHKLASLKFITLYASNKEFKIDTKDEMIRDFMLTKPHRIVCDFKRDIDIRSFSKKMQSSEVIREFRVGNHKGYYRVVIELDGYYRYKFEKTSQGYVFKLL